MTGRIILAIETSCDETAIAILRASELLASEIASQSMTHEEFGGVVPEVAARDHIRALKPLIYRTLEAAELKMSDVDAFAATSGPGLATSLMIGVSAAKGLAVVNGKPFIAVNHLEGHLLSPFFGTSHGVKPALGLVVSGGHTSLVDVQEFGEYKVVGQTLDDAAGEAFDKVAKMLGLPYPGGPEIDHLSTEGNPKAFEFPRSMLNSGDFNFSFSGLKTAVRYQLAKLSDPNLPDLCASFQEAVVDVLVEKTLEAAGAKGRRTLAISGGVSCNRRLRQKFTESCEAMDLELLFAAPDLSTDNAAMIAYVAMHKLYAGEFSPLSTEIDPNAKLAA